MDGTGLDVGADPEAVALGPADVPEMLDLVERTQPGPFLPRTIMLGTYLGIRRGGALVAMAGERMRPPGWTEISAVCTDPAHRGQGLRPGWCAHVGAVVRERATCRSCTRRQTTPGRSGSTRCSASPRREIFFGALRAPASGTAEAAAAR
jgi:hypothetical protein